MADERRPMGFWEQFNVWWRTTTTSTGERPRVDDIKRWYDANAGIVWPWGQAPTLEQTKKHAKGMRRLEDIPAYFREYRLKCKGQDHTEDGQDGSPPPPAHNTALADGPTPADIPTATPSTNANNDSPKPQDHLHNARRNSSVATPTAAAAASPAAAAAAQRCPRTCPGPVARSRSRSLARRCGTHLRRPSSPSPGGASSDDWTPSCDEDEDERRHVARRQRRHSAAAATDLDVRADSGGSSGSSRHASPMPASPQQHHHRSSQPQQPQHHHHAPGHSPQILHSPRSRVSPLGPSSPHTSRLGAAQPHTQSQSQQQERQPSGWFYSPGAGSPSSGGAGAKRGVNPRGVEVSAASASHSGTRPRVDLSAASATTAAQYYAANPRASRLSPHELLVAGPAGGSGQASPARAQRQGGGADASAWTQQYQRIDQEPYSAGGKAGRGTGGGAYEDAGPPGSAAMAEMLPGAFSEPLASVPGPMAVGRVSGPSRLGGGGPKGGAGGAGGWGGGGAPPPWEAAAAGV